ncbi:MAG: serine/threonine-protein kinase [Polyangiales bacterium]
MAYDVEPSARVPVTFPPERLSRWRAAIRAEWLPSERRAIHEHMRELTWQRWVWPAGFTFDVLALLFVYPGASWPWVLGLRLVGAPLQPLLVRYANRPDADADVVTALSLGYTELAVILMALQGLALGGWESPWVLGALGFTFAGSLVAELRAVRVAEVVASWPLLWVLTLVLGAWWFPEVRAQSGAMRSVMFFAGHWAMVGAVAGGSVHFGQRISMLRRELHTARRLARYRLQSRIGVGGMNEVWLAWDDRDEVSVALKILRRDPSSDAVRRFQREAEALRELTSEHTVRVHDVGASDDGVLYIAMEYLDGMDLSRLVERRGAMHPGRAVSLMRQACASLAEAHRHGIVHRDVKPSNLFLTRHPHGGDRLKVLDFGIARRTQEDEARLTLDGDAVGTPHFMAPETFHGVEPAPQVDVYGLGATLYFLLTGRRPFEGWSGPALAAAVISAPVDPPSAHAPRAISLALDALVMRAISRDLSRRHASIAALDDDLAEAQASILDELLDEGLFEGAPDGRRFDGA